jgi:hypothetical protein
MLRPSVRLPEQPKAAPDSGREDSLGIRRYATEKEPAEPACVAHHRRRAPGCNRP